MNTYWIACFNVKTVWHVARHPGAAIHYLTMTPSARRLLAVCPFLTRRAPLHAIQTNGESKMPILGYHAIKNDAGTAIVYDILSRILTLRRQGADTLLAEYGDFFFTQKKATSPFYADFFASLIAREITSIAFLAYYIRFAPCNQTDATMRHTLIIPATPWSSLLQTGLRDIVAHIRIIGSQVHWTRKMGAIAKHLLKIAFSARRIRRAQTAPPAATPIGGSAMVTYSSGLDPDLRSDIAFWHDAALDFKRLFVYFGNAHILPTAAELEFLDSHNSRYQAGPAVTSPFPQLKNWRSTPALARYRDHFLAAYWTCFKASWRHKRRHIHWFFDHLWKAGFEIAYWQDFFNHNRIGMLINANPTGYSFILHTAIAESGGLAIGYERSICHGYCLYLHNPPNHANFMTGPYSIEQIPEPPYSLNQLYSGYSDNFNKNKRIDAFVALRRKASCVFTLFDEFPGDHFLGPHIQNLYMQLLQLIENDDRFAMIVKSKKELILKVLPDVGRTITRLQPTGRIAIADWKVSPSTAAVHSDIVITFPSTVAVETILAGTRTVTYNATRGGCAVFYRDHGLGRLIFEDGPALVQALKEFAAGERTSLGNCSHLIHEMDPFHDGLGPARIGGYVAQCLTGLDAGLPQRAVIARANQWYAAQWGADKIPLRQDPPQA